MKVLNSDIVPKIYRCYGVTAREFLQITKTKLGILRLDSEFSEVKSLILSFDFMIIGWMYMRYYAKIHLRILYWTIT